MSNNKIRSVLTLLLFAAFSLGAQAPEQLRIANSWIATFNSGDVESMAEFRKTHWAESDSQGWRDRHDRATNMLGTLEIVEIQPEESTRTVIIVHSSATDEVLELIFSFESQDSPRLTEVSIKMLAIDDDDGHNQEPPVVALPSLTLEGSWTDKKEQLNHYFAELTDRGIFSGTFLIGSAEEVIHHQAFGLASIEFSAPATTNTRFDVGSFNKDYTRVAIQQLKAQGLLSLDDFVGLHLPDYPNEAVRTRVTIQQLLNHRSGIPDYFDKDYVERSKNLLRETEDYIPIWGPKPLLFEPGTEEEYSNYGYTVLGAIIEEVSGKDYSDYVEDHIFAPADMNRSGFFSVDSVIPEVATGYTHYGPNGIQEQLVKNIFLEPAKGGPWGKSYSTADDLYRFIRAVFDGDLMSAEDSWLGAHWNSASFFLAGGGAGLSAAVSLDRGTLVIVLANLDEPIAEQLASIVRKALIQSRHP